MNDYNLKDYVCLVPFFALEVQHKNNYLCCASWLKKDLPKKNSIKESWESEEAQEIRKSVLDGSFKYCDHKQCPFLQYVVTNNTESERKVIQKKKNLTPEVRKIIESFNTEEKQPPATIQFSFDRSCNLKCPSCRVDLVVENSNGIERVKKTIQEIEEQFGNTTRNLYITGTGDPFVSVGFRDFLRNFDSDKWPKLQNIHLHTNATKWTKEMWDSMKNVHKYVKSCEISIDAATKDTYENKVRLNGNWDKLVKNLEFISTIPTLKNIKTSFVVQSHNYREMKLFYEKMLSIFGDKVFVFYGKINNWGTYDNNDFENLKVWDKNHPEHLDFVKELNSFLPAKQTWHNLHEFVETKKSLI